MANLTSGEINFYCGNTDYYFARPCPSCDIVQVDIEDDTFVYVPCLVCSGEKEQCPRKSVVSTSPAECQEGSSQPAFAGVYQFEPPVCLTCQAMTELDNVPVTTITVPCPICQDATQKIPCPTAAASSLASLASESGASVASEAAATAVENAKIAAITMTTTMGCTATSTVVNVPCASCAVGSRAVAVPQVAAATVHGLIPSAAPFSNTSAVQKTSGSVPGNEESGAQASNPAHGASPDIGSAPSVKESGAEGPSPDTNASPNIGTSPGEGLGAVASENASLPPTLSSANPFISNSSLGGPSANNSELPLQAFRSGKVPVLLETTELPAN